MYLYHLVNINKWTILSINKTDNKTSLYFLFYLLDEKASKIENDKIGNHEAHFYKYHALQ